MADEADRRPLLQDDSGTPLGREQMRTRVEQMLTDREAIYSDAHATVDATLPLDDVVDAVTNTVRERGWVD